MSDQEKQSPATIGIEAASLLAAGTTAAVAATPAIAVAASATAIAAGVALIKDIKDYNDTQFSTEAAKVVADRVNENISKQTSSQEMQR